MRTVEVAKPEVQVTNIVSLEAGQRIQLDFDTSTASFERVGNDLTVNFSDGGAVVLSDFFVSQQDGELPTLVLQDGTEIASADFLHNVDPDMDLSTADGPSQKSSSGISEYAHGAGDLVDGVDRLGSLGSDQWGRAAGIPQQFTVMDQAKSENVRVDPVDPVDPKVKSLLGYAVLIVDRANEITGQSVTARLEDMGVDSSNVSKVAVNGEDVKCQIATDGSLILSLKEYFGGEGSRDVTITMEDGTKHVIRMTFTDDPKYELDLLNKIGLSDYTESKISWGEGHKQSGYDLEGKSNYPGTGTDYVTINNALVSEPDHDTLVTPTNSLKVDRGSITVVGHMDKSDTDDGGYVESYAIGYGMKAEAFHNYEQEATAAGKNTIRGTNRTTVTINSKSTSSDQTVHSDEDSAAYGDSSAKSYGMSASGVTDWDPEKWETKITKAENHISGAGSVTVNSAAQAGSVTSTTQHECIAASAASSALAIGLLTGNDTGPEPSCIRYSTPIDPGGDRGGDNTIGNAQTIIVNAQATAGDTYAESTEIDIASFSKNTANALGMRAGGGGRNHIQASQSTTINSTATGGNSVAKTSGTGSTEAYSFISATGVQAQRYGENHITGSGKVTVNAKATGGIATAEATGTGSSAWVLTQTKATGISTAMEGTNTITGASEVTINAIALGGAASASSHGNDIPITTEANTTASGIENDYGTTIITAGTLTVNSTAQAGSASEQNSENEAKAYGIYVDGCTGVNKITVGQLHTNSKATGQDAITDAYGLYATDSGLNDITITGPGESHILAEASTIAAAIHGTDDGTNSLTLSSGVTMIITAKGGENNYAMLAQSGGLNILKGTASAGQKGVTLEMTGDVHAQGKTVVSHYDPETGEWKAVEKISTNRIETGAGNDSISIKGNFTVKHDGQSEHYDPKNIIDAGAGDDIIRLDGTVGEKGLYIDGGADYDVLILHAKDWTEFKQRYEHLFQQDADDKWFIKGVEEIKIVDTNDQELTGPLPEFLQNYLDAQAAEGNEIEVAQMSYTEPPTAYAATVAMNHGDQTTENTVAHAEDAQESKHSAASSEQTENTAANEGSNKQETSAHEDFPSSTHEEAATVHHSMDAPEAAVAAAAQHSHVAQGEHKADSPAASHTPENTTEATKTPSEDFQQLNGVDHGLHHDDPGCVNFPEAMVKYQDTPNATHDLIGLQGQGGLWLSLVNDHADRIDAEFLSEVFKSAADSKNLYVTIDANDSVDLASLEQAGWQHGSETVVLNNAGVEATYTVYTQELNNDLLTLYVHTNVIG